MADTSLAINTTDQSGKKLQKALTDINPNADTTVLKTFAQGLNNLTTNNYQGSVRVIKTTLDDETAKLPRNLQLYNWDVTTPSQTIQPALSNADSETSWAFGYDGDGDCYIKFIGETEGELGIHGDFFDAVQVTLTSGDEATLKVAYIPDGNKPYGDHNGSIVAYVPESSTYEAATITVTITGGNS